MTDLFDRMLWAYHTVLKQTGAGGGHVTLNITARERMLILYGMIGPDDYAAARAVSVLLYDGIGGKLIARVNINDDIDDMHLPFPSTNADPVEKVNEFSNRILIGKGESLKLTASSLIQNEEMTVTLKALITSTKPSMTTTGSTGTVTNTVVYDKVI